MSRKTKFLPIVSLFLLLGIMGIASADTQCSSQDCYVNTSVVVSNNAPTIISVESGVTVTLTAESTVAVTMHFNASDVNGASDINDSTPTCSGYKTGETTRTDTLCTVQSEGSTWEYFNCTMDFYSYDAAAADWKWNCTIADNSGVTANNNSVTFTVNSLNYVDQNVLSASWAAVTAGVNDQEAGAPVNFDNGGNQDYESCSVTAYNATYLTNIIPASAFALNSATGTPAGTAMVDSTPTAISSFFTLPSGSGSSEDVFFYVDMPSVTSGTYTSTAGWLFDITA